MFMQLLILPIEKKHRSGHSMYSLWYFTSSSTFCLMPITNESWGTRVIYGGSYCYSIINDKIYYFSDGWQRALQNVPGQCIFWRMGILVLYHFAWLFRFIFFLDFFLFECLCGLICNQRIILGCVFVSLHHYRQLRKVRLVTLFKSV